MTDDLTRWNRAGLPRFRYVDGNAITYLERLRRALQARLPAWTALEVPQRLGQSPQDQWTEQYHGDRRDFAWEIARTLSRSVHVLTEHLDAYANEGYLRTATQWDSVRRLVEMLDYHPAPPASASTPLVLVPKPGRRGLVKAGFQVKNAPEDGSPPVKFETLEDLEVDAALAGLRCADWNRSQQAFAWTPTVKTWIYAGVFPAAEVPEGVSQGSRGVLLVTLATGDVAGIAVKVSLVAADQLTLTGPALPAGAAPKLSDVRLLLAPRVVQKPRLHGPNAVELDRVHGLTTGAVIAWQQGSSWYAARVTAADNRRVTLTGGLPPLGAAVVTTLAATRQVIGGAAELRIPLARDRGAPTVWRDNLQAVPSGDVVPRKIPINDHGDKVDGYDEVTLSSVSVVHYVDAGVQSAGTVVDRAPTRIVMDGDPGNVAGGQWVLLAETGGAWEARRIAAIEQSDDSYSLQLNAVPTATVVGVHADLAVDMTPAGHDINLLPAFASEHAIIGRSVIPLASIPDLLDKGRRVVVEGAGVAVEAVVTAVDRDASHIVIKPALPGDGAGSDSGAAVAFTRHGTVIHANVAPCGHGETKPVKILGSGDATASNQRFELKVDGLAFVADATQPAGVRAALEVTVAGRAWDQVATLNDSGPTDHHYEVRMNQEGHVDIRFGDGQHGRRLPTGASNVRAVYRVGSGGAGNLAPGSAVVAVAPHPLVASVRQPIAASGGGDMETAESLRRNAPASLLTLGRAVSLRDFGHLAASQSSVWHARAFATPTGLARHETVKVVVVPAGGGAVTDALRADIEAYLEAMALPGVQVVVAPYVPIVLDLSITVQVITSAFDPDVVVRDVRAALTREFSLERAAFARTLYRASVTEVIEAVTGVENSVCVIRESTVTAPTPRRVARGASGDIRAVFPADDQIVFIDPAVSQIDIAYQEFTL